MTVFIVDLTLRVRMHHAERGAYYVMMDDVIGWTAQTA